MTRIAPHRMTVDEHPVWATGGLGRWELADRRPVKMSPETPLPGVVVCRFFARR